VASVEHTYDYRMAEQVDAVIEELLEVDLDALDDAALHEVVVRLERQASRFAAAQARLLSAWDARGIWAADRSRSPSARLARDAACSPAHAGREVRRARKLRTMPATRAAFEAGELSTDHVDVLAAANHEPLQALFARDEELLVGHARALSFDDFVRLVRHWRNCADDAAADDAEDRAAKVHAGRYARKARTFDDAVDVQARLGPLDGAVFGGELDRLERELFEADWAAARAVHGDDTRFEHLARTAEQRRADALVVMAKRSAAMPADARPARYLVTILIDAETFAYDACGLAARLFRRGDRTSGREGERAFEHRTCELADGTVLTPAQVAGVLTEADVERIVFGPGSRVIDVGVRTRCFTGATRRAVEVRDRHCTFPGCREPADRCEVDHIVEYASGGLTTQDNGRLLCAFHNRQRPGRSSPPADGP
jgi:hypothetical protein